jgi:1-acyl-sn-glycerol-3-phosphate acyltransferase
MVLTMETLAGLPSAAVRSALPAWIASHLQVAAAEQEALAARLAALVAQASDDDILALRKAFNAAGEGWRLHPANPLARTLTRAYMAAVVQPWTLEGGAHLGAFCASTTKRRMIVCNHLSYTDTQVTDVVLALAGRAEVADRLVAIAGPKVYTEPWRRMAAIALNTRKTAQSSGVASEQASLTPRELAAIALETIADCQRLMDAGYIVLLYPEGTRARDGRLQPFLRAAVRYLAIAGVEVLPLAQNGGERVFPVDAPLMQRASVSLRFGEPLRPAAFAGKWGALEAAHRALARLLPAANQPGEGRPAVA